jgi:nucleotide-binding universal stress UspA family protein
MFHKILVAVDESDVSQTVFDEALSVAKAEDVALMLLHVLSPLDNTYPGDPYIGIPVSAQQIYLQRWEEREQAGLERLRSLQEAATAAGISAEYAQNIGDPGRIICTLSKTWNADLIVIGRRGLSGLSEFLLGSVSNYVLHHAPCHVLTIQTISQSQEEAEQSEPSTAHAPA